MGKMNLLKANWEGKVGQTVGAKWKNKSTIRTFTKPSNPKTQAQVTVREAFAEITSFVALFADQIKYLTALNTRGQSVRNAIISANKEMIQTGTVDFADLIVSKGGLPPLSSVTASYATNKVTVSFTPPVATNITEKALAVAVAVDKVNKRGWAGSALLTENTVDIATGSLESGTALDVYYYIIDYRGSSKVGSSNGHSAVTVS